MSAAGWPAPAKINLFLHVTGRRPDGYHLLQTLFQFVDHGDTLEATFVDRRTGAAACVARGEALVGADGCLLYTSPSPRDS